MFSLPNPILLIITVITSCLVSISRGAYSKYYPMTGSYLWIYNSLESGACFFSIALLYFLTGQPFKLSFFSVGLGLVMALVNVFGLRSSLKAISLGPYSYTVVITSLSTIITALSGMLFFGEPPISIMQYIGIALMICSIILSPDRSNKETKSASLKWMVYCALAMIFSGSTGICQKTHQHSATHASEMPALLLSCFFFSSFLAWIMFLKNYKKDKDDNIYGKFRFTKKLISVPLISGLGFCFPHTINLVLSGRLPAVVFFPIVNLCPMILCMIYGVFAFKERLSGKQWIGVIIGIMSTVFLSGIIKI